MIARELAAELEDARRALFEIRERRVQPGTDDKVLTAWNALAIGALAEAGRVFGEPALVPAAVRCAEFVLDASARRAAVGCCARGATASPAGRGSPTTTR